MNNSPVATIKVPATADWNEIKAPPSSYKKGIHNLFLSLKTNSKVEVDWVKFE
jgi:hypothetical protein